jgi:hypothetical protein
MPLYLKIGLLTVRFTSARCGRLKVLSRSRLCFWCGNLGSLESATAANVLGLFVTPFFVA